MQYMHRYKFLFYVAIVFLLTQLISRLALSLYDTTSLDFSIVPMIKVFIIGFFYDAVTFSYYSIPLIVYLFIIPKTIFNHPIHKVITLLFFFLLIFGLVFGIFSEWLFWEEFGKRFNFIAVDYLVYTNEVVNNIRESYNMPLIFTLIFLITLLLFGIFYTKTNRFDRIFQDQSTYLRRFLLSVLLLSLPILFFMALNKQSLALSVSTNRYNQELSKNGTYSLFSAFRNNELNYSEFYNTSDTNQVLQAYRKLVSSPKSTFISPDLHKITRQTTNTSPKIKPNVMLVMIESLSASYMGIYGNKHHLTPYLDKLTEKSLFFNQLFATGTRTVRGMEAVTMSIPPTPGRSIIKRPQNHDMFGIGWVFKSKGYTNRFIYAGHGYFDNMNEYFSHNAFKIVDRLDFEDNEITFSNVWGVCDEDLYKKAIQKADESYKSDTPFFHFIMTTSNHRPYTYPEGKIDIPSHTGRKGGVKYTDYAIEHFLLNASSKPWFDNTIFVFIADHNGGSAGKRELPLYRYRIPLIVYAPKLIKPQTITKLASQIDVAPTLFSLMGWSYKSKFYGKDILDKHFQERALIGNYQKLGLYKEDRLTILLPNKQSKGYIVEKVSLNHNVYKEVAPATTDIEESIAYYQSASYLYKHNLLGK